MSHLDRDPWVDVKTFHGFAADHVISALQKEIRRGHTENAALLAYEMILTSPAMEEYMWYRLKVISVEDIGFGDPMAPVLVQSLYEMTSACDHSVGERKLYAIHAVRYLCACQKDRSSDEMINWIINSVESGETLPVIPITHWICIPPKARRRAAAGASSSKRLHASNRNCPGRDKSYLERIIKMLDEGKLKD